MMACLIESRRLYNEMLEHTKNAYSETGKFASIYDLNKTFKGRGEHVPATTVQTLSDRLGKALKRYLSRKDIDPKAGFPRFKSGNQWHSIALRQFGRGGDAYLDEKRLRLPKKLGGAVKVKLHRPLEGTPKTGRLVLRADGHWYVQIVCETKVSPVHAPQEAVGLDVGLKVFLADSEGNFVQNPRPHRKSLHTLRRKQRTLCRRKKGSHRRRKAAKSVAKTHLKIARQRKDFLHKTARQYVNTYRRIVIEDLNVSGMVRNHCLARSIQDASWSAFADLLKDKAESAGQELVRVPAHFTSRKCFSCGELVAKTLSVRTHVCPSCGYVADRDVNAARNILRAGTPPSDANVSQ